MAGTEAPPVAAEAPCAGHQQRLWGVPLADNPMREDYAMADSDGAAVRLVLRRQLERSDTSSRTLVARGHSWYSLEALIGVAGREFDSRALHALDGKGRPRFPGVVRRMRADGQLVGRTFFKDSEGVISDEPRESGDEKLVLYRLPTAEESEKAWVEGCARKARRKHVAACRRVDKEPTPAPVFMRNWHARHGAREAAAYRRAFGTRR